MKKLGLIIPYRNRQEHLRVFIPQIKNFIDGKIPYKIAIIEQSNDKPFNRAKLLNIGFDLLKNECSWFCFHDIDMLPISNKCDYTEVNEVVRLSQHVSQFNNIPRPHNELGGVILIDKNTFLKINGYSNEYWGWGCEDDDLYLRCINKNINISTRDGIFSSLQHEPNGDTNGIRPPSLDTINNRKRLIEVKKDFSIFEKDGLNNLIYEVKNISNITENIIFYSCDI